MKKIAVCLLSGGLDSCVAATLTKKQGYELYLLTIDYGQIFKKELQSAQKIGKFLKPKIHKILLMKGFKDISQSAFTNKKFTKDLGYVPLTYPPGRDPTFIMVASAWLESIMLQDIKNIEKGIIVIGINKYDRINNQDCKKKVYRELNKFLKISTKVSWQYNKPIKLETPLINLTKTEIIKLGTKIGAPIHFTRSCYENKKFPCGKCDACKIRYKAFKKADIKNQKE